MLPLPLKFLAVWLAVWFDDVFGFRRCVLSGGALVALFVASPFVSANSPDSNNNATCTYRLKGKVTTLFKNADLQRVEVLGSTDDCLKKLSKATSLSTAAGGGPTPVQWKDDHLELLRPLPTVLSNGSTSFELRDRRDKQLGTLVAFVDAMLLDVQLGVRRDPSVVQNSGVSFEDAKTGQDLAAVGIGVQKQARATTPHAAGESVVQPRQGSSRDSNTREQQAHVVFTSNTSGSLKPSVDRVEAPHDLGFGRLWVRWMLIVLLSGLVMGVSSGMTPVVSLFLRHPGFASEAAMWGVGLLFCYGFEKDSPSVLAGIATVLVILGLLAWPIFGFVAKVWNPLDVVFGLGAMILRPFARVLSVALGIVFPFAFLLFGVPYALVLIYGWTSDTFATSVTAGVLAVLGTIIIAVGIGAFTFILPGRRLMRAIREWSD
jgi:uncharacterized membrane protein YuzA (DUF378 family)